MDNGTRASGSRGLNKGHGSKFREGSQVRQTPEEDRRYRPKRCKYKDEGNSPKTPSDTKTIKAYAVISYWIFLSNMNDLLSDLFNQNMKTTTQSGPFSNGDKRVFFIRRNWRLTIRYNLVSYPGHTNFVGWGWSLLPFSKGYHRRILNPTPTNRVQLIAFMQKCKHCMASQNASG